MKRNLWVLAVMALGSIGLRLFLYSHGLHHEPWTNRFFPTELLFFLLGIFSYRFSRMLKGKQVSQRLMLPWYLILICFTIFFSFLPKVIGSFDLFQWLYYVSLTISLPFVFQSFKTNHADAFLGELAYPVFVSHFFVILLLRIMIPQSSTLTVVLTILITLLFSMGLLKLLEPINRFRQTHFIPVRGK